MWAKIFEVVQHWVAGVNVQHTKALNSIPMFDLNCFEMLRYKKWGF